MPDEIEQSEAQEIDTLSDTVVVAEEPEEIPFKYSITSYGADLTVDGLVKRIRKEDIFIPPFQRGYVWSLKDASRFIESLLLGLPVPSVFLSKEGPSQKMMVIDGQQRLRTLQYFYDGIWPPTKKEFSLKGVQSHLEGATYKTLNEDDRRRLDDSIMHAIIVKQEEPSDDSSSIYHIFERLNAGGVLLTPQEIRSAIHHGELSKLLSDLNKLQAWREIYGPVSKNMRDQELILRFFALLYDGGTYKKPMKEFLNIYMGKNRFPDKKTSEKLTSDFVTAIELLNQSVGPKAFRPAKTLNAAVFDAVMVGAAKRLQKGKITDLPGFAVQHHALLADDKFKAVTERATADEESVSERLKLAEAAFANVK